MSNKKVFESQFLGRRVSQGEWRLVGIRNKCFEILVTKRAAHEHIRAAPYGNSDAGEIFSASRAAPLHTRAAS